MSNTIAELLGRFRPDGWRKENGFSAEIDAANQRLFDSAATPASRTEVLNEWIRRHQPCLFGRAAAAQRALQYCLITEEDVAKGDEFVRRQISEAHLQWTAATFEGKTSGFIVLVISPIVASASPNADVLEFAKAVAKLYLYEDEIEVDRQYHDVAYLAIPDQKEHVVKWKAGVNYFSAHADRRWWQDHRIPGGLGFSTNSVGHLAKSGKLLSALNEYTKELGIEADDRKGSKIESLERALVVAMQTIDNASESVSGRATELKALPADGAESRLKCPIELPPKLAEKNYCSYRGYYHTDFTLPAEYFKPDVERPIDQQLFEHLDFTYLFNRSPDNTAYFSMGEGVPVRDQGEVGDDQSYKLGRMLGTEVAIATEHRLLEALAV